MLYSNFLSSKTVLIYFIDILGFSSILKQLKLWKLGILNVLVTGGAGFIGSEFIRQLLAVKKFKVYVIDSLRYAGSLLNLSEVQSEIVFKQIDIRNRIELEKLFIEHNFSMVINFAAETHVDNSITGPKIFFE